MISSQSLFTVYIHPAVSYYFSRTSIFYEREIQKRINTTDVWGKFKLLEAELYLLSAALQDTNNKYSFAYFVPDGLLS